MRVIRLTSGLLIRSRVRNGLWAWVLPVRLMLPSWIFSFAELDSPLLGM